MNLAFYIESEINDKLDLTQPSKGNAGVGGTIFCFLLLIESLLEYNLSIKIYIFTSKKIRVSNKVFNIIASNLNEVLQIAEYEKCDFVILQTPMNLEKYKLMSGKNSKIICWSHNYINSYIANEIASTKEIVANVFVGKQMYDFYYDHDIINKSTFIYNIVPDTLGDIRRKVTPETLVYMGSIIKQKGIIELFKIWEIVEKKFPQAILHIVGSGKLYSSDNELGIWNIASPYLESKLECYFVNSVTGKVKNNIIFHGILGKEKYILFLESSVGIVNPSSNTETFGMGIVEMATAKLPVVTRKWNGHLDTAIDNETALLGYTIKGMANRVIELFKNNELNERLGENAKLKSKRFSSEKITPIWFDMLLKLKKNEYVFHKMKLSKPYFNNYKFLRFINSFLRFKLKLKFLPSIVVFETKINDIIKKLNKY